MRGNKLVCRRCSPHTIHYHLPLQALRARAKEEGVEVAVVSAKVESELNELPKEEAKEWLESLGVTDGGLSNLIRATYSTLGLATYFTTGACMDASGACSWVRVRAGKGLGALR